MGRKAVWSVVALVVMLALPAMASAQTPSWQDVQVADIEQMKDKWIGLAMALASAHDEALWRIGAGKAQAGMINTRLAGTRSDEHQEVHAGPDTHQG